MNRFLLISVVISLLVSCSNTPDLETGEIKTLALVKQAFQQSNKPKRFIDARLLLNRKQIDKAKVPVLFVELPSGQNGTLTPYPGRGVGQTWLAADGATITMDRGVLKASRGMGNDLMGSASSMPSWFLINKKTETYRRELGYINGDNKIFAEVFSCDIEKINSGEFIKIWGIIFKVAQFEEQCLNSSLKFTNTYHVDTQGIVRRSSQYHSDTLGSVTMERLDR